MHLFTTAVSLLARPYRTRKLVAFLLALFAGIATGCDRGPENTATPSDRASKDSAKRHAMTGEIMEVSKERKRLIVKHEEIPGFMPAMTMEFIVSEGDFANARVGQRISAVMVENEADDYRLERIWPADPTVTAQMSAGTMALVQDTTIRGRNAYREVGESAPEFTLYNQDGQVVSATRFRGKQVMINFIFTRCPVATMCPLAVEKFRQTQAKAKEAGVKNLEMISISLEPAYDTPGVLKDYAVARSIDTKNYTLLTGPDIAVKSLLAQFGVLAEMKGDLLNHTLSTLLLDETGKIVWRADGSAWSVDEFVGKMRR